MKAPLDILADLRIDVDGEAVTVSGAGDRVVVNVPSPQVAQKILRTPLPGVQQDRRAQLRRVSEELHGAGVTLDVHLQGTPLARLGKEARPGGWSRLLNLGQAEVRSVAALGAARRTVPWSKVMTAAAVGILSWGLLRWLRRS
ncbi:MAG: hypothetical protein AAGI71_10905 [Bacteroidota bacterium]